MTAPSILRAGHFAIALVGLLATGCATVPHGPINSASPSKVASPTAASKGPSLALVGMGNQMPFAPPSIYSTNAPAAPVLLKATTGHASSAKFLSANKISYVQVTNFESSPFFDWTSTITTFDLQNDVKTPIASLTGNIWSFDWSPDGTSVAFELQTQAGWQLWIKRGSATPVPLTQVLTNAKMEGGPGDGVWVTFSPSGTYLALANTFAAGPHIRIFRVADGSLIWSASKGGSPFWWRSGDRLYFEDFAGEHVWRADQASISTITADGWIDPAQSPDGNNVAYTVQVDTGPQVEIRDLQSGSTQRLALHLVANPTYASGTVLWMWQMAKSQGLGIAPYQPTGVEVAFDLVSRREVTLPFTGQPGAPSRIFDIWPH
jgi:hypothetical protein